MSSSIPPLPNGGLAFNALLLAGTHCVLGKQIAHNNAHQMRRRSQDERCRIAQIVAILML